jgi:LuxR family maltose regulon positive regulatory protein
VLDRPTAPAAPAPIAPGYDRATALLEEARDALRTGEPARATALLVRAQALLSEVTRAAARAAGTHEVLDELHGSAPTDAERRVLVLLATDLTLSEIGGELFLSRNTVKTHVWRLYRRLGVRTRAEAVEVARAQGHLPPADPSPSAG